MRVGTVPLAPISRVFLRGSVTLEAKLLGQLGDNGTGVVFLSGRQGRPSLFLGRAHNDAARRVAQIRQSLDPRFWLRYAQQLIRSKVQLQQQWLDELRQQYPQARFPLTHAIDLLQEQQGHILRTISLESLRGIEGAAACAYFAGLRAVVPESLGFAERNRRPPRDPFNVLLSLTYTLLMAEIAMALHNAGFDPAVGYYHQISFGRESLACDLIEPLRAQADRFCLDLVSRQTLTAEHFSSTTAGCLLGKAGRLRYYSAYEEAATELRKAAAHEVKVLARLVTPDLPEPSAITRAPADDPSTWTALGNSDE